jgi:hypothetical protein
VNLGGRRKESGVEGNNCRLRFRLRLKKRLKTTNKKLCKLCHSRIPYVVFYVLGGKNNAIAVV